MHPPPSAQLHQVKEEDVFCVLQHYGPAVVPGAFGFPVGLEPQLPHELQPLAILVERVLRPHDELLPEQLAHVQPTLGADQVALAALPHQVVAATE